MGLAIEASNKACLRSSTCRPSLPCMSRAGVLGVSWMGELIVSLFLSSLRMLGERGVAVGEGEGEVGACLAGLVFPAERGVMWEFQVWVTDVEGVVFQAPAAEGPVLLLPSQV